MRPITLRLVAQDLAQLADALHDVVVLGLDLLGLQCGEALQPQVEDRLGLDAGELEPLDQALARRVGIARSPDQLDDLVDVLDGHEQALEDVQPGLALAQLELGAAHDHVALVIDVVADDGEQPSVRGTPSTSATMFTPKVVCSWVCL